jgi:hypothetical protein
LGSGLCFRRSTYNESTRRFSNQTVDLKLHMHIHPLYYRMNGNPNPHRNRTVTLTFWNGFCDGRVFGYRMASPFLRWMASPWQNLVGGWWVSVWGYSRMASPAFFCVRRQVKLWCGNGQCSCPTMAGTLGRRQLHYHIRPGHSPPRHWFE